MVPLRLAHQMGLTVLVSQALEVQGGQRPQRRHVVRVQRLDQALVVQVVLVVQVDRVLVVQVVQASRFLHHLNHLPKAQGGRPNHRPSLVAQVVPSQVVQVVLQELRVAPVVPIQVALVVPSQVVPVVLQELRVAQVVPIQVVLVELVVSAALTLVVSGA